MRTPTIHEGRDVAKPDPDVYDTFPWLRKAKDYLFTKTHKKGMNKVALSVATEFAKQQKQRYSELVKKMKNDPKKIKTMVNKTVKHLDKMMKEVMDLKSPTMKKYINIVQKEYGENASDRLDSNQFKAASEISQRSSRLYEKYSYYFISFNL